MVVRCVSKVFDNILERVNSLVLPPNSKNRSEDGDDYSSVKPWKCWDYRNGWWLFSARTFISQASSRAGIRSNSASRKEK